MKPSETTSLGSDWAPAPWGWIWAWLISVVGSRSGWEHPLLRASPMANKYRAFIDGLLVMERRGDAWTWTGSRLFLEFLSSNRAADAAPVVIGRTCRAQLLRWRSSLVAHERIRRGRPPPPRSGRCGMCSRRRGWLRTRCAH